VLFGRSLPPLPNIEPCDSIGTRRSPLAGLDQARPGPGGLSAALPKWMRRSGCADQACAWRRRPGARAVASIIEKREFEKRWHASRKMKLRQPEHALHRRSAGVAKVCVLSS
jgi:hypothetical protein